MSRKQEHKRILIDNERSPKPSPFAYRICLGFPTFDGRDAIVGRSYSAYDVAMTEAGARVVMLRALREIGDDEYCTVVCFGRGYTRCYPMTPRQHRERDAQLASYSTTSDNNAIPF